MRLPKISEETVQGQISECATSAEIAAQLVLKWAQTFKDEQPIAFEALGSFVKASVRSLLQDEGHKNRSVEEQITLGAVASAGMLYDLLKRQGEKVLNMN